MMRCTGREYAEWIGRCEMFMLEYPHLIHWFAYWGA